MGRKPVLTRVPDGVTAAPDEAPGDDPGDAEEPADPEPPPHAAAKPQDDWPRKEVVLEVMGREVFPRAGDTIGRDIRTAMVEAGAPEDDAEHVHREHARLEWTDGQFFLERLGENSLRVNDRPVEQGERVRITDGDVVEFADVVTATVHIEDLGVAAPAPGGEPIGHEPIDLPMGGAAGTGMHHSLTVLINTIPGEVLVLWAALEGATDLYNLPVWASAVFLVLVVIATPVYVYRSIDNPDEETDPSVRWWQESNVRWQSVSATGAFLVWVYYLGGPFQAAGLQDPALATVLVIIYPVLMVISPYYGSLILYHLSNLTPDGNRGPGIR